MRRVRVCSGVFAILAAIVVPSAFSVPPAQFTVQGRLSGFSNQSVQIDVRLYDAQTGGVSLYSEVHGDVVLADGVFAVQFGGTAGGIPMTALYSSELWLGVSVNGQSELPRIRVNSAPLAMLALRSSVAGALAPATGPTAVQVDTNGDLTIRSNNLGWLNANGDAVIRTTLDDAITPCRGGAEQEMFNYYGILPPLDQRLSLLLDTNDVENGFSCDAFVQLYDSEAAPAIELHADRASEGPEISLFATHPGNGGNVETIELLGGERVTSLSAPVPTLRLRDINNSNDDARLTDSVLVLRRNSMTQVSVASANTGPKIELHEPTGGNATVTIVGTDDSGNPGQGGQITLADGTGQTTLEIDASEGSGGGATVQLRDSAGNITIELDADHGGGGGPGRVITQQLEITGGSDLSEQFTLVDNGAAIEPGMVVCIDPENPGRLITSTKPYDRTVAGVISGAGGIRPGMMMGQRGTCADGEHPIALVGRVWVWCDSSDAPIRPGDLLTTSTTPGHAMRATDHSLSPGSVLGKAMTSLPHGTRGLVLVLVSLQ